MTKVARRAQQFDTLDRTELQTIDRDLRAEEKSATRRKLELVGGLLQLNERFTEEAERSRDPEILTMGAGVMAASFFVQQVLSGEWSATVSVRQLEDRTVFRFTLGNGAPPA